MSSKPAFGSAKLGRHAGLHVPGKYRSPFPRGNAPAKQEGWMTYTAEQFREALELAKRFKADERMIKALEVAARVAEPGVIEQTLAWCAENYEFIRPEANSAAIRTALLQDSER